MQQKDVTHSTPTHSLPRDPPTHPLTLTHSFIHYSLTHTHSLTGERGGSVVECRTPEREVQGSRPTSAVLCPWARHFTPRKYWLITQEAMAPSRHDWKIVDWDVKPQHNQSFTHTNSLLAHSLLTWVTPFSVPSSVWPWPVSLEMTLTLPSTSAAFNMAARAVSSWNNGEI